MNPVRPEELSALLDAELSAERAREVRTQLAIDPDLNAQFEALRRLDVGWRKAGAAARFVPVVSMPMARESTTGTLPAAALMLALLSIRILPKLLDLQLMAWALHAVAFVLIVSAALWLLRHDANDADGQFI